MEIIDRFDNQLNINSQTIEDLLQVHGNLQKASSTITENEFSQNSYAYALHQKSIKSFVFMFYQDLGEHRAKNKCRDLKTYPKKPFGNAFSLVSPSKPATA